MQMNVSVVTPNSCNPEDWLNAAFDLPKFRLIPLSPGLAYRSSFLPQPFHNDPADQIIAVMAMR